jgi:hypothetical protein
MSGSILSLVLNGLILIMLAASILYSSRLSIHIRAFRNSRKELDKLIKDLGTQIERADQAISDMRDASKGAGKKLQDTIVAARQITDELMVMTDSGNNLSARLEKLAGQAKSARRDPPEAQISSKRRPVRDELTKPRTGKTAGLSPKPSVPLPNFSIRDTDFDRDDKDSNEDPGLASQAERELYEALRSRKPEGGKP